MCLPLILLSQGSIPTWKDCGREIWSNLALLCCVFSQNLRQWDRTQVTAVRGEYSATVLPRTFATSHRPTYSRPVLGDQTTSPCTHTLTHTLTHVLTHTPPHIHTQIRRHSHTHTHTPHTLTHTLTHTHTHTHTHSHITTTTSPTSPHTLTYITTHIHNANGIQPKPQ